MNKIGGGLTSHAEVGRKSQSQSNKREPQLPTHGQKSIFERKKTEIQETWKEFTKNILSNQPRKASHDCNIDADGPNEKERVMNMANPIKTSAGVASTCNIYVYRKSLSGTREP